MLLFLGASDALCQSNVAEFQKVVGDKLVLEPTDFMSVEQGETVIKLLPALDKREIAVGGMVRVEAPAEMFLQSFRESMTSKSNPAILEIGKLSNPTSLDDFQGLTVEDRDVEDLRQCVVGDCRLKLSAPMIQRLQAEVDWSGANYRTQVTQLLKQMLVEYVRDYLARGDEALLRYDDKAKAIRIAEEQRELIAASSFASLFEDGNGAMKPELTLVENAIVWSKIKFGLKPVLAINHILIYKRAQQDGAQILIVSKQIYANHYFDSSLALTAFMNLPGQNPGSYLFYENRSRVDGLEGPFGKFKRSIIEDKAVSSLKSILNQSQLGLANKTMNPDSAVAPVAAGWNWKRGKVLVNVVILLLWVSALVVFLSLRAYGWKKPYPRKPTLLKRVP
ncbi:MAG TPA: hypothetical protein VGO68_04900 [Pyrinomonadaceae bacterium]|nr:hypothetical protein [Pyrinomonadaceae bacterium]